MLKTKQTKNLRITVRVEGPDRQKVEELVASGRYTNLSEVLRDALTRLLKENAGE
jgi:Arc/MetJ-type ribon-helix-helix transcriptional regulator